MFEAITFYCRTIGKDDLTLLAFVRKWYDELVVIEVVVSNVCEL